MKNPKRFSLALVAILAGVSAFVQGAGTRRAGTVPPSARANISETSDGIVCLMYHRFVTADDYAGLTGDDRVYTISVERFDEQLSTLKKRGYQSVTTQQAIRFVRGAEPLHGPSVLITIDDGNRGAMTLAGPVLRKHGMRATLFVTTDPDAFVFDPFMPDQVRLSDDEIRSLDPQVFEVGAHGVSHRPLRELGDQELAVELRVSRETLSHLTGRPVRSMAVPGNWYDARVLRFAQRAGYEAVFVSDKGLLKPGGNLLRMPRYMVQGYKSLAGFERMLSMRHDLPKPGNS